MLVQRLRRWPNNTPALGQGLLFAEQSSLDKGWPLQLEKNPDVKYSCEKQGHAKSDLFCGRVKSLHKATGTLYM